MENIPFDANLNEEDIQQLTSFIYQIVRYNVISSIPHNQHGYIEEEDEKSIFKEIFLFPFGEYPHIEIPSDYEDIKGLCYRSAINSYHLWEELINNYLTPYSRFLIYSLKHHISPEDEDIFKVRDFDDDYDKLLDTSGYFLEYIPLAYNEQIRLEITKQCFEIISILFFSDYHREKIIDFNFFYPYKPIFVKEREEAIQLREKIEDEMTTGTY